MSNPEQIQMLATIGSLTQTLEKQVMSDIQLDLLQVVQHLMTNIAVQSTMHGRMALEPGEPAAPLEFQVGEPVDVMVPVDGQEHWQRTTVINKQYLQDNGYAYQTAYTKRDTWIDPAAMRKVQK